MKISSDLNDDGMKGSSDHFVHFYHSTDQLAERVADHFIPALSAGNSALLIATPELCSKVTTAFLPSGLAFDQLRLSGQLVVHDAKDLLSQIMRDNVLDSALFFETVGNEITRLQRSGSRLVAFGEMVALLVAEGNQEEAVRLEKLWNQLGETLSFSLFCAYPLEAFKDHSDAEVLRTICSHHSMVIPAESFSELDSKEKQAALVVELQQKASLLEAELARRKRTEEELIRANRSKDEFLAMLAHELRNPLSAIASGVALIRRPQTTEEQRQWVHNVMNRQVSQLSRLLDDLLDVSRITRGKITLQRTNVEFQEIVQKAAEAVSAAIKEQDHHFTISKLGCDECWINGDAARVQQILVNILANAIKYTPTGGNINLAYGRTGAKVIVTISDSGVGIAPEMLSSLFDLFMQDERTLDRSQGGLGVGLSIVKRLIELHSGQVSVESDGIGKGTTVTLSFPALDTVSTTSVSQAPASELSLSPKRVLIVDDNKDAAIGLSLVIRAAGHEVKIAHSSEAALATIQNFTPEFALLDIGLPNMDGYCLAEAIREQLPDSDIQIFAITGYGQEEHRARSARAGFERHLVKPVDEKVLLALLTERAAKSPVNQLKAILS